MIKVGIVGGAGYTGGEAIRILIHHPLAQLVWVNSTSSAGKPFYAVHSDLFGDTDMCFTADFDWAAIDVAFLCVAHGDARKFMNANTIPSHVRIIDLSQDYRIEPSTDGFVYGLTEMNREKIKGAARVANPGCFATAMQLALLPLADKGLITNEVNISAVTGSTGAGQSLSTTSHFSWRANNLSVYKAFEHQHLREVHQMITHTAADQTVNFIPYRGDFTRGILATVYTKFAGTIQEAYHIYSTFYATHPFTHVSDTNIALKQVVNTNKCLIYLEKHGDNLMIISEIDNLLKGASGQAVENMNLMFSIDQTAGLQLKSQGF
ncbi:MAG: N-acetyl-gamma-glutamyl-phosphate reductase [Mucinivorans sp.]